MLSVRNALKRRQLYRQFSSASSSAPSRNYRQTLCLALSAAAAAGLLHYHTSNSVLYNDAPLTPAEVNLQNVGGKKGTLTSEGWGSNKSKVLSPDGSEDIIKTPAALPWLEDIALRDLVLHGQHAACVDARGDVYQWGQGLIDSEATSGPTLTLRGKNIKQLSISNSRVVALSHSGQIYVLKTIGAQPVSPSSSRWGLWDSGDVGASVELTPQENLSSREHFTSISAGQDHLLALTSSGRTFTHPFTKDANEYGQLGLRRFEVPSEGSGTKTIELTPKVIRDPLASRLSAPRVGTVSAVEAELESRGSNVINFCCTLFEVPALKGIEVSQIAAGGRSSFVSTTSGRVLGWGANEYGQIGLGDNIAVSSITVPTEVVLWKNVSRRTSTKCVDICAAGDLTFFTVERRDGTGIDTVDVLACGNGQSGSLGSAVYSNAKPEPVRVKNVSGLLEYSEQTNNMQPIRPHSISVSPTGHVLLALDTLSKSTGIHSGRDLMVWGANYDFQLGTGKRSSLASATNLHRADGSRYMLMTARADVVKDLRGAVWKRNAQVEQTAVAGVGNSLVYWRIV